MLRIFVTSSHISAIFQLIYARNTVKEGYVDVLFVDSPNLKKSIIDLITDTQKIYPWKITYSFATAITDETNMKPGFVKKSTRYLKNKPGFKEIYNVLLKRHEERRVIREKSRLLELLAEYKTEDVELNLLTKTALNGSLISIYPKAKINYFEHGMGDYWYVLKPDVPKGDFYCLFAERFKMNLENKKVDGGFIYPISKENGFLEIAKQIIENHEKTKEIKLEFDVKGKLVVIMMESVEVYQVPDNFWTDYIDLCLSKINNPAEFTFIIKPHHLQSFNAIEITKSYVEKLGLKVKFADNAYAMSFSAEVLFSLWQENTHYAFSVFSSSIYYISKLYPNKQISYYYGYDFFRKYIKNSPPQFVEIYNGIEELVKEVLSENCKKMV
jgi:hypothetical protein